MRAFPRVVLALTVACATAVSARQAPRPATSNQDLPDVTFRVEVNYVEVDAFVQDAQGNPVTDLTANDFELLEEGTPQKVSSFAMVNLPIELSDRPLYATAPVEPDVRSNVTSEGRIYVILLDDLHIHPTRAPRVRAALRQFVQENLGTNDLAAVVSSRGYSADSQDFTNNPRLLTYAIERFTGKVPFETPETDLVLGVGQATPADPTRQEEAQRARTLMQSMRTLGDFLGGVRGRRKTIIFVSEGIGYDIYNTMDLAGGAATGIMEDSEKAVASLTRANVSVYAIDPRGLVDGERLANAREMDQAGFRRSQDSLRVLAAQTGGFAAVNQSDLAGAFDRIVRENSSYYILGYYPTNERRDGAFRKVQVQVRRPGVQVRSRRGYVAPRGDAPRVGPRFNGALSAAAATALSSPLPVKGVPVHLFAAPYKGSSDKAAIDVAIEFDPSALGFTERNGTFTEEVEIIYSATEPAGKIHTPIRHALTLALEPDTFEQAKARGIRVLSNMELPPGRYQLRAAVGNRDGAAGSVLYDLEVPDFRKSRLGMSGISLTSAAASRVATARPAGKMHDGLPGPATAARTFMSGDTLALYGEVYENDRRAAPHTVDIVTDFRAPDGRLIVSRIEQRSSAEAKGSGIYTFMSQLTLTDLPAGLYVIHVQATSNIGERATVARDVQIRVVDRPAGCGVASVDCRSVEVLRNGPPAL